MSTFTLFYLTTLSLGVAAAPVQHDQQAVDFMRRFGYIEDQGGGDVAQPLISQDKFQAAVREVQKFGGLPETGRLDKQTLELMTKKRCGVPDIMRDSKELEDEMIDDNMSHHHHTHHHHHHHDAENVSSYHQEKDPLRRRKRFILASRGWDKKHLTYQLTNVPAGLTRPEVETTLRQALQAWERHAFLRFSPSSGSQEPDILFTFFRREHGDRFPFDGRGNVLAHAFFPGSYLYEGDVHFDGDEEWLINPSPYDEGVELYTVALHELGHSLGLSHSSDQDSVMNPYYKRSSKELGYDDIQGIYRLYGGRRMEDDRPRAPRPHYPAPEPPRTTEVPRRTTFRPQRETTPKISGQGSWSGPRPSDGCFGSFDAVALLRNELFIIKDKLLWRLAEPGRVQEKYPVDFHRFFHKLPKTVDRIDAIYQRDKDSKILIFTGREYRVFDGSEFEGSARPITDFGLPDYVKRVDAVTSRNNTAIIFTGDRYWLYDELKMDPVKDSPRPVQDWGLTSPIDSALTYKDGVTYFFKDDMFWEYDEKRKRTVYHKPWTYASDFWLGC